MLTIEKVDHVGIRISEKTASIAFYRLLGFDLIADADFEQGHPIIMRNLASGVTVNLLGPSTSGNGANILMDVEEKYPGYTHMAMRIASMDETKVSLDDMGIVTTGSFSFGGLPPIRFCLPCRILM